MRKRMFWGTLVLGVATFAAAQSPAPPDAKPTGNVARGKYLVNNIGMCGDCHTPMNQKGEPLKGKTLQGAPIMFTPTVPIPGWAKSSPGIAGLDWTEEQAITFFTTGKRPDGTIAAPPMPQIRLNKTDAAAVYAYLKTLKK